MSWAAHDLEPYVLHKHFGLKIAFVPLLIGSYAPDMMTKWFVYGITVFGERLKADNPAQFHRGWPGVGFTHSLLFGVVIGAILWRTLGKSWGLGFMIGHWAHALTDIGDTYGTMLLFPFSTDTVHVGAWAYAGQTGRFTDAAAYYSGLGWVWDGVWLALVLVNWRTLTSGYFFSHVLPADVSLQAFQRRFSRDAVLVLYRVAFLYGACRWLGWLIWAHVIHHYPFDLSWGGPHWVDAERPH
ncbi:MAG: metal-dependent hydrolase [Gaiellales bacterium]